MNKQALYDAMKGRISMKSFDEYSDEMQIIGKFGLISWMDGYWDIWITGIHHGKELTQRKVNSLSRRISARVKCDFQELTGEATSSVRDNEGAYICAVLMGARKKRRISANQAANLRKNQFKRTK